VSRPPRLSRLLAAGVCALCALAAAPAAWGLARPPSLSARAAILVERSTGQVLFARNAFQELPIASTTKLMTALLVLEHARLSSIFTEPVYYPAPVDSQIGLRPGERMSVHDLMLALLLPSADDAAQDLAFIGMMDARARQLGLAHTHYSTPIGLDTPGNYSTAADLVKLASFLRIHHPFFAHAVALPAALLRTGDYRRFVTNRNTLVGRVPWINGVKTGHTGAAGYVLVGSGTQGGVTMLSAVLGTPSEAARNADTLAVLKYGFANFRIARPVLAGAVLARPTVKDRPGVRADVIAGGSFVRVLARSIHVSTRVVVAPQLAGPLKRHAVVGSVVVLADGRRIARIPLLLDRALPAVSPLTIAARFIVRPFTLLALALLLGGGAGAIAARRRRRHTGKPPESHAEVAQ
jgi:serine-type D-Ala-D-Ala carboxypeptidase (penicillin-binding protein 5/6)